MSAAVEAADVPRETPDAKDCTMNLRRFPCLATTAACRIGTVAALALSLACVGAVAQTAAPSKATTSKATTSKATTSKAAAQAMVFASPQAGVDALVGALRRQDAAELRRVLGPDSIRVIDSGDDAADREAWGRFVAEYDARHRIRMQGEAKAWLDVGATDWPMPIPLVKRGSGWVFDTAFGAEELVARRIGRNELDAIQVCEAFIDMELEYAEVDRNGDGLLEYTDRLISSRGKRDGLYWPTVTGEPPSPAGPRLAQASTAVVSHKPGTPFHGYYYRVLTRQGKNAPGGARDWMVGGKLIGGVALLAWPASYLSSGVKTFMCAMDGVVWERDFGPDTDAAVARITAYDPGPGWRKVK